MLSMFKEKEEPREDATLTTLWSTFYELVDDTSQVAKSHASLAESLLSQLLDPINASINEMEQQRQAVLEESQISTREIHDAASNLKKAQKQYDKAERSLENCRSAFERVRIEASTSETKQLEKLRIKVKTSEDRLEGTKQALRFAQDTAHSLRSKYQGQDVPRIITALQCMEGQRGRLVLSYILGMIELERRCAVMNENYANDMALKLKQVDLQKDEQRFTTVFAPPKLTHNMLILERDAPIPLTAAFTPATSKNQTQQQPEIKAQKQLVSPTVIPRAPSMPPAYESHPVSLPVAALSHAPMAAPVYPMFAASSDSFNEVPRSRQLTKEYCVPSHP